jgi:hypothetical protein
MWNRKSAHAACGVEILESGVMRADWDSQQLRCVVKGLLQFTPEQGELIRSHVWSAHPQA